MFYLVCIGGILLTVVLVWGAISDVEDNKAVVFDVHRGELWVGDNLVASYRKGSRNYQLMRMLYQRQGQEVSLEEIQAALQLQNNPIPLSKILSNLRLSDSLLCNRAEDRICLVTRV